MISRMGLSIIFLGVVLLTLSSCGMTGKKFADKAVGFSVTRVKVVRVQNLDMVRKKQLADGVAIEINNTDCEVSMKLGQPTEVIMMRPGSILVMGEKADFVLQPYRPQEDVGEDETASFEMEEPTGPPHSTTSDPFAE